MAWADLKHALLLSTIAASLLMTMLIPITLYRPLPGNLTSSTISDRVTIHILEPLARIFYYYPTRLCPTAHCRLNWMRKASDLLYWAIGPTEDNDSHLQMETTYWDGVKVRIYYPRDRAKAESDGAIVYTHGGGFSIWSTEIYESLTRELAKRISARLFVSVDYRLAPETVFPGGLENCERVLEYVFRNGKAEYGMDPRKVIVMGDSAGGNLAAALAQRRRASGAEPKILGQALIYPWLQMSDQQTPSFQYWKREMNQLAFLDPLTLAHFTLWYAGVDVDERPDFAVAVTTNRHVRTPMIGMTEQFMDYSLLPDAFREDVNCTNMYQEEPIKELSEHLTPLLNNPSFAPLMQSNLSDLPPALVITCEFDILRDEGVIYAQRLKNSGVPTKWVHLEHGFHGMLCIQSKLDVARQALDDIKNWTMALLREVE